MRIDLGDHVLRRPEPRDVDALLSQKNDPEVALALGGFHPGMARADVAEWLERHRTASDEVLWVLARAEDDRCVGQAGLYRIDHRIRSAEFAIAVGDGASRGRGLGRRASRAVLDFGFGMLNLNRVELSVLETNDRARRLYASLGFREEGRRRQAQYKAGRYLDVIVMSLLREEWGGGDG